MTEPAVVKQDKIENENVAIRIHDLYKSFGDQEVLKGVNLHVNKKENLVVLGKSGTGKSVLIKCIVGLMRPDHGEINVLGNEVTKLDYRSLNELRKKIGFLFQSAALYDSMTVRENLRFPLIKVGSKLKPNEINDKMMEVLENVGLAEAIDKMPSQLSGGMRKRIGLARTLILDPEIVLYDEPTTGLDPVTSNEISKLILQVQEKYKTSSIIITHDIACARITANRAIMLNEGKNYADDKLNELEKSDDPVISSFFK